MLESQKHRKIILWKYSEVFAHFTWKIQNLKSDATIFKISKIMFAINRVCSIQVRIIDAFRLSTEH